MRSSLTARIRRIKSRKPIPALKNQKSIGRCKAPLPKAGLRMFRIPWASRWGGSLRMRRDISTLWTTSTMVDWVASPLNFWALRVRKNFIRMIRRTLSASLPNLIPPRKRQQFTSKHSQRANRLLLKNKASRRSCGRRISQTGDWEKRRHCPSETSLPPDRVAGRRAVPASPSLP